MTVLYWDLQEWATRDALLQATFAALPDDERTAVKAKWDAAVVPEGHHRNLAAVLAVIDALDASERVKDDLRGIYRILAEAEAAAHGCYVDSTAVQAGKGTVRCAHGELSVPAPATAAILARGIPVCKRRLDGERCTPTSAAIILHFVDRFEV